MTQTLAFDRDFRWFTGGHLKCFHYYSHARAAGWAPEVRFTPDSVLDATNPWIAAGVRPADDRATPGAWFLAGHDWERVGDDLGGRPVINLLQHVRHADPADRRFAHLRRPAIRVAVSDAVAEAVLATGVVNGPVFTIPNGIDLTAAPSAPPAPADRRVEVLVVANKASQRQTGLAVARRLRTRRRRIAVVDRRCDRRTFLDALAHARIAVFVPNPTEGFYMPALEAMALGALVVCPDVVGNRSFCRNGETAVVPNAHGVSAIVDAAEAALALDAHDHSAAALLRARAAEVAADHDMATERARFHTVLADLEPLWAMVPVRG